MGSRTLLILANSLKHGGRCVAGIELLEQSNRGLEMGGLLRPVASRDSGALNPDSISLSRGRAPRVLDVVEISLKRHCHDPGQCENWENDSNVPWKFVQHLQSPWEPIVDIARHTSGLWPLRGVRSDRVPTSIQISGSGQSLKLIVVEDLKVCQKTNFRGQLGGRGRFTHAGTDYDLSVTDDVFLQGLFKRESSSREIPISSACLMCISLATPFMPQGAEQEYNFKLIASIIPFS